MVKCSKCGVDVDDSFETCPNCGNDFSEVSSNEDIKESNENIICSNCGEELEPDSTFCSRCGSKVEIEDENRCVHCGGEIPPNLLFCPNCGEKVNQIKPIKTCSNCGMKIDDGDVFCQNCGANVITGKPNPSPPSETEPANKGFADKINLNKIMKPTILAIIVAIVLSSIGLLIGLSRNSFIIAILLSVGFFAGVIDNEANALISGILVGVILGFLESPLVEFWYGSFVAGFYDWYFGGQILLLIILGAIVGYGSNIALKPYIRDVVTKFAAWF